MDDFMATVCGGYGSGHAANWCSHAARSGAERIVGYAFTYQRLIHKRRVRDALSFQVWRVQISFRANVQPLCVVPFSSLNKS